MASRLTRPTSPWHRSIDADDLRRSEVRGEAPMSAESAQRIPERSEHVTAERRLKELGITLPAPPEPFGTYAEAVQTNNLLFLTGMLPTQDREAAFIGRVGAELDVDTARKAARL